MLDPSVANHVSEMCRTSTGGPQPGEPDGGRWRALGVTADAAGKRRGHGEDSICWDESRKRSIGAADLGPSPAGARIRKKVSGKTKAEVRDKLRALHKEVDVGLRPRRRYTAGDALEDWLAHGMDGLSARAVTLYRGTIVKALNEELGGVRLTELTASDVQRALTALAGGLSTRTVQLAGGEFPG